MNNDITKLTNRAVDWHELSDSLDVPLSLIERKIYSNADIIANNRKRIADLQREIASIQYEIAQVESHSDALKKAADTLLISKGRKKRWVPDPVHTNSHCEVHGSCIDCDACTSLCECL